MFTKEGRCYQDFGDGQRIECTYKMLGSSAIVRHQLNHVPLSGKLLTITVHNKATPERGGAVIYLEPFSGRMLDERTGAEVPPGKEDEAFMKANRFRWEFFRVPE